MGLLDGKVALVTGGAQGLGLAIAQRFTAEGAVVVIADLDGDAADAAAATIAGATSVRANVVDPDDVAAMIAHPFDTHGRLDILINNAGITRDKSLAKMTLDDFRLVMDVHLQGTWLGLKEAFPRMRSQGDGGSIVNMSSVSGKVGNFGQTNYSAAKAGIIGMTKAAAKEGARHGIRVNAVMPGLIRSAMTEAMPQEAWDSKLAEIPMGRAGEPDEVAGAALFLASDLSSYSTGITVEVTGGRHV
ncbi:MAG: 3-oxoacyl-[acyl-carrier protein] reductase [Nitriliruptoraceae bacterium]|jgi:3-oxoacyl-[acyl-carrier protein] reductase